MQPLEFVWNSLPSSPLMENTVFSNKLAHETRGVTLGWGEKWDKQGAHKESVAVKSKKASLWSSTGGKTSCKGVYRLFAPTQWENLGKRKINLFFFYPQKDNQHEANAGVWVFL